MPLGKFGLRDAVFVRDRSQQPLRRLVSVGVVKRVLEFFDGDFVERFKYVIYDFLCKNSNDYYSQNEQVREAALLSYLNRTCFNGLYRGSSNGEFDVSFGRYSNPDRVQEQRIRKASRVLRDIALV